MSNYYKHQDTTEEELMVNNAPSGDGYHNFVLIGVAITTISGIVLYLVNLS